MPINSAFTRTDNSIIGNWWWTVDRWLVTAIATLIGIGIFLNFAASPAVAKTIGVSTYHFVQRQLMFMPLAIAIILALSLQTPQTIKKIAIVLLGIFATLVALTPFLGVEIKGATRWISLGGFSLQPSEFVKPAFAVVTAWLFSNPEPIFGNKITGSHIACVLYAIIVALLLSQPDVGMTLVISLVWATQFFIAGLPIFWVVSLGCAGIAGMVFAYFNFSHVQIRVNRFLHPEGGLSYQVKKSLDAFENGGWFGRGPGEGQVKQHLPDAHTDFILAVAGEEFGLILCLFIVAIFAFIVLKVLIGLLKEENQFILLAASGLMIQFGLQASINMASTLHLAPTKGMTLPFISYGGSSLLALSITIGMLLSLTRKRGGFGLI